MKNNMFDNKFDGFMYMKYSEYTEMPQNVQSTEHYFHYNFKFIP